MEHGAPGAKEEAPAPTVTAVTAAVTKTAVTAVTTQPVPRKRLGCGTSSPVRKLEDRYYESTDERALMACAQNPAEPDGILCIEQFLHSVEM